MDPTEEESTPLVIRDRGGSQRSSSSTGVNLQVHLYFVPATKKSTTIHISSGPVSAEAVCIQAGEKSGKSPLKRYVSELTCPSSIMILDLVAFLQGFCLSTLVCLAWHQLTFPFGILPHTCLTWKKTFKSASESGGWKPIRRLVTSITPSETIIALTDPSEFLNKVKKMVS